VVDVANGPTAQCSTKHGCLPGVRLNEVTTFCRWRGGDRPSQQRVLGLLDECPWVGQNPTSDRGMATFWTARLTDRGELLLLVLEPKGVVLRVVGGYFVQAL
jgi:hypothetical protein